MAPKPVASRGALPLALSAALAWSVLPGAAAEAIEFDEADIFLELNATDGDLGVHVSIDAASWRELHIQGPGGQRIVEVAPRGNLARIGLTELFLEGEEPSLEEVPFARFLTLVPTGTYTFLGTTTGGEPLRSTDPLTAELPCPVAIVSPPEDGTVPAAGLVVRWRPAPGVFDPDRGRCDARRDVGLVGYQVIVEFESEEADVAREFSILLPPGATEVQLPRGFLEEGARLPGAGFAVEVLAIEDSGNKTITEQEFEVE
jgi:hypothetical protein